MPSRVGPSASGDVESVCHSVTVLALPVPCPLEAVSVGDTLAVSVKWAAVLTPLLQSSLSLCVGGSSTAEACLGLAVVLYEMLAVPVSVGAFLAWEVDRPIRSESLLAAWG